VQRRGLVALLALGAVMAVIGGCAPPPAPYVPIVPPCPYPNNLLQINGESVAFQMASQVRHPDYVTFNAAQSRSGFTYSIPADAPDPGLPPVPSISETVKSWIESCGVPEVLVIAGAINDLAGRGLPASTVQGAVVELADWLRDRQVQTIWVTVVPLSVRGNYLWTYPQRQSFNDWLRSGGPGWGTTVDCVPALENPNQPDVLNPAYEEIVDIFGNVDGIHPNPAGARAFAACVAAALP